MSHDVGSLPEIEPLLSPPRRPWRFTLRTWVLVLIIASLMLAQFGTSRRLREAENELRVLRRSAGRLVVEDRSKIQLVAVPSTELLTWQWRVYLPAGFRYQLHSRWNDIPDWGAPTDDDEGETIDLAPGEHTIVASARATDAGDGQWNVTADGVTRSRELSTAEMEWTRRKKRNYTYNQAGENQAGFVYMPNPSTELLHVVVRPARPPAYATGQKPLNEGILVWITKQPD